jgi:hypothetical protein
VVIKLNYSCVWQLLYLIVLNKHNGMSSAKVIIASQAWYVNVYRSLKSKVLKCCANIYFNKQCLLRNLAPKNYSCVWRLLYLIILTTFYLVFLFLFNFFSCYAIISYANLFHLWNNRQPVWNGSCMRSQLILWKRYRIFFLFWCLCE